MQQRKVVETRFVNTTRSPKAELPLEGFACRSAFFKNIREGPEGQCFDSFASADSLRQRGTDVGSVAAFIVTGYVPFGP